MSKISFDNVGHSGKILNMSKKSEPVKQIRVELELYNALVKIKANSVVKASLPAVLGHAIRNGIDATRKFFQPTVNTKSTTKKGQ